MFTYQDYKDAMEVFTIKRVKERLQEDKTELDRLNNFTQEEDRVIHDQRGTTIIKGTSKNTIELNKKVLRQNIIFWNNILEYNNRY